MTQKPPDPSAMYRWKEKMSPEDIAAFDAAAGELLDELGYEVGDRLAGQHPRVSGADFGERAALSEELEGKYLRLDDDLYAYVVALGTREDEALARVRRETAELGDIAVMQISPDQGALLTMLARLLGARRALELGTFTGYSAICIARGLADGGLLVACELDPDRARGRPRQLRGGRGRGPGRGPRRPGARHARGARRGGAAIPSTWPSSTPTRRATTPTTSAASSCSARAG